jgi:hypothetical protein
MVGHPVPVPFIRPDKHEFRPFAMVRHGLGSFCLAGVQPARLPYARPGQQEKEFASDGYYYSTLRSGIAAQIWAELSDLKTAIPVVPNVVCGCAAFASA